MSDALHRFFYDKPLIAATCKRCGKLVAVYWGSGSPKDEGWRPAHRCRCDPPLPTRTEMAAKIAQADAAERKWLFRAPVKIYV
ncbi:hypothetical protein QGN32_02150 [Mycolicibacterium sp. ND9-15]|uniref:hypothetical protein n=1 Tax=Mycolicibacterium sp. ND9-15 TaxID=3042320 RepID=UPI002DD7B2D9|nr:hypothetical protein [Mycolicibacterium sp. ND9-15]WSE56752.1 hypothetical protein QGN32_02150 [Mycolicibacterium sp. ND9-15]